MVDIQSPTAEIRRGKKKKKPQDENIMVCPIIYGDHKKKPQGKNIMSASATQGGHKYTCLLIRTTAILFTSTEVFSPEAYS